MHGYKRVLDKLDRLYEAHWSGSNQNPIEAWPSQELAAEVERVLPGASRLRPGEAYFKLWVLYAATKK